MGQVEILGRDRKRSVKRKKGAKERSISIGTKQHDNKSEQQAHNRIQHRTVVCYLTKHAFSHQQQHVQNSQNVKHNNVHTHIHIYVKQNSSDIIYCVTIINFDATLIHAGLAN